MKKGTIHTNNTRAEISSSLKEYWRKKKGEKNLEVNAHKLVTLSSLVSRAGLAARLGKQFDGDRDLYDILGYKSDPDYKDFYAKYDRQDVASRIVDAPTQATWRHAPIVYEENSKEPTTAFEIAWNKIVRRLKVFHYLERLDRLSGIGRYGILLIGVSGRRGYNLEAPLVGGLRDQSEIAYLQVYTEGSATISEFSSDRRSPDFGKPAIYTVDLSGNIIGDVAYGTMRVHSSRVIHVAEGVEEDEVYGRPRLRPVFNLLDDLEKVVGGSAEMFWQGAYRGLHININPDFQQGDLSDDSLTALQDEIDEYIHGLRRFIRTQGVDINTLKAQIADPSGVFDVLMNLISGASKIPKRILIGSERGELASSQDEINWNARIKERQEQYAEPNILRAFIDKLIALGALPEPKADYKVIWPSLFEMDDLRKAQAVWTWARAAEKLADAVNVNIISKEQAFEILAIPGLIGLSSIGEAIESVPDDEPETDIGVPKKAPLSAPEAPNDDNLSSEDLGREDVE